MPRSWRRHTEREREFSVCAPVNIIELLCNTSVFVLVLAPLICQVRHRRSNLAQQVAGTKKRIRTVFTTTYIHQNMGIKYKPLSPLNLVNPVQ